MEAGNPNKLKFQRKKTVTHTHTVAFQEADKGIGKLHFLAQYNTALKLSLKSSIASIV